MESTFKPAFDAVKYHLEEAKKTLTEDIEKEFGLKYNSDKSYTENYQELLKDMDITKKEDREKRDKLEAIYDKLKLDEIQEYYEKVLKQYENEINIFKTKIFETNKLNENVNKGNIIKAEEVLVDMQEKLNNMNEEYDNKIHEKTIELGALKVGSSEYIAKEKELEDLESERKTKVGDLETKINDKKKSLEDSKVNYVSIKQKIKEDNEKLEKSKENLKDKSKEISDAFYKMNGAKCKYYDGGELKEYGSEEKTTDDKDKEEKEKKEKATPVKGGGQAVGGVVPETDKDSSSKDDYAVKFFDEIKNDTSKDALAKFDIESYKKIQKSLSHGNLSRSEKLKIERQMKSTIKNISKTYKTPLNELEQKEFYSAIKEVLHLKDDSGNPLYKYKNFNDKDIIHFCDNVINGNPIENKGKLKFLKGKETKDARIMNCMLNHMSTMDLPETSDDLVKHKYLSMVGTNALMCGTMQNIKDSKNRVKKEMNPIYKNNFDNYIDNKNMDIAANYIKDINLNVSGDLVIDGVKSIREIAEEVSKSPVVDSKSPKKDKGAMSK